ncbi:MAG: GTP-dependent dephospho-CoA kinase family protein [Halobacteriales archaeon]
MPRVVLELPESLRGELKEPLGTVETDAATLLAAAGSPLIAVGDIVTYHLTEAGGDPGLSLFDERTKREPVAGSIAAALAEADLAVENPAGTLTEDLLIAIAEGIDADEPRTVRVDGEEDLAALPAIVAAPGGASVVYGQPDEGMVHVRVTPETRERARDLLSRMDGDVDLALSLLE